MAMSYTYDTDAPRRASEYAKIIGTTGSALYCIAVEATAAAQNLTDTDSLRVALIKLAFDATTARNIANTHFEHVAEV